MLPSRLRVLYLHGFASGPGSRKAQFFAEKLGALKIEFAAPDLAENNFERLTLTGQLQVVDRLVNRRETVLIGSSLGGYLASLYAAAHPAVTRLLLLAPAFGFLRLWHERLGPAQFERWRATGRLEVFHYGLGHETTLGFDLMSDAERYPLVPNFTQPALIIHGNQDDVVPVQSSVDFVRTHANARLVRLNSGHELTDVLNSIWQHSEDFLIGERSRF